MANGRNHLLKASEPLTGQCGIQPMLREGQRPDFVAYDPASEVPPSSCRPCLMVSALSEGVIDPEPMGFARGRGVVPLEESDLIQLELPFE